MGTPLSANGAEVQPFQFLPANRLTLLQKDLLHQHVAHGLAQIVVVDDMRKILTFYSAPVKRSGRKVHLHEQAPLPGVSQGKAVIEKAHEPPPNQLGVLPRFLAVHVMRLVVHHNEVGEFGQEISNHLRPRLFLYVLAGIAFPEARLLSSKRNCCQSGRSPFFVA